MFRDAEPSVVTHQRPSSLFFPHLQRFGANLALRQRCDGNMDLAFIVKASEDEDGDEKPSHSSVLSMIPCVF